jgi:hypothetical protein
MQALGSRLHTKAESALDGEYWPDLDVVDIRRPTVAQPGGIRP